MSAFANQCPSRWATCRGEIRSSRFERNKAWQDAGAAWRRLDRYTNDPTELVVFQEIEVGERKVLKLILRLHMEHVTYPNIAQTIALLEQYFTPVGIGVDNGGNGLAVVQELLTLDKYKALSLEGRVKGYDFGGMTHLAVRDGKEVKKRTKELMIARERLGSITSKSRW